MKRKRRVCVLAALAFMLAAVSGGLEAKAREGSCRVQIQLPDLGTVRKDVEFGVYQVGVLEENSFRLLEAYRDTGVDLEHLETAEEHRKAAERLTKAASEQQPMVRGKTDEDGLLSLGELDYGAYLMVQQGKASYGKVESFLVLLPCMEEGQTVTDLTLTPKASRPGSGGGSHGGDPGDPDTSGGQTVPTPTSGAKTGDEARPVRYLLLAILSAGIITVLAVRWRRRH